MTRAIGVKTLAAVGITAMLVAVGASGHVNATYLGHLSAGACFLVALVASLAVGLVGVGWRFDVPSKLAVAFVRRTAGGSVARGATAQGSGALASSGPARLVLVAHDRPIELPAMVQRGALLVGCAVAVLGALGNHAAARIAQLPDELAEPSPSEYCMPEATAATAAEPPPPPIVVESEQPGCALVKRAFALGYAKSLGACAPKQVAPVAVSPITKREVCTRRQLDEPMLHYGFRRVADAFSAAAAVDPVHATEHRVGEVRTQLGFMDGLLANIHHAITGTPHATHHLWVNLPDPHPTALSDHFVGEERCSQRFADLPLWPAWQPGDEARLVEHVLGQLLFATRFGTTASCSDYVIHWSAAVDTCARLIRDPIAVLADSDALLGVRAVLDRRRRQLQLGALAVALGKQPRDVPPAASAIASLSCFIVDPAADGAATGTMVEIDGDPVGLREIRVRAVRTGADGPIDVYAGLAALLAGKGGSLAVATVAGADGAPPAIAAATAIAPEAVEPHGGDFLLVQLDPLIDADPFRGARAPLQRAELVEVFPFQRHLHAFIDGFRRRYLAQRGRL